MQREHGTTARYSGRLDSVAAAPSETPAKLARPWLIALATWGCAHPGASHAVAPAAGEPGVVAVERTIVTPGEAVGIGELFERAVAALKAGEYERAGVGFDRVFELDPRGGYAARAALLAGEAYDEVGDLEAAVARYESAARAGGKSAVSATALVRAVRIHVHRERWERAAALADVLLEDASSLQPFELIVAHGAKALHLADRGERDAANYYITKGRDVIEMNRLDAAGRVPRDLAALYYALGEVERLEAERVLFVPLPENFAAALERRCQAILDAQSAYSDAMRAYDAHWSAMAGYRVGELYERLHDELMRIEPPASARTDAERQLFEGAMRVRYAILLRKARTMMEHTLELAERTGEKSGWIERTRDSAARLERAMLAEERALARLPYSRDELERAFEDLRARAEAKRSAESSAQ